MRGPGGALQDGGDRAGVEAHGGLSIRVHDLRRRREDDEPSDGETVLPRGAQSGGQTLDVGLQGARVGVQILPGGELERVDEDGDDDGPVRAHPAGGLGHEIEVPLVERAHGHDDGARDATCTGTGTGETAGMTSGASASGLGCSVGPIGLVAPANAVGTANTVGSICPVGSLINGERGGELVATAHQSYPIAARGGRGRCGCGGGGGRNGSRHGHTLDDRADGRPTRTRSGDPGSRSTSLNEIDGATVDLVRKSRSRHRPRHRTRHHWRARLTRRRPAGRVPRADPRPGLR